MQDQPFFFSPQDPRNETWVPLADEGQLAVDVFRDQDALVIRAPLAGVLLEDIDLAIHGDLLTIRGKRESQTERNEDDWYYKECYWGAFSRSLVLPLDVYAEKAEASLKNGILEVRIPVRDTQYRIPIRPRSSLS